MLKSKLPKISEKEKEIMSVLWYSKEPLTASAIVEKGDGLNINTVQTAMRNLLKKKYIKVADIVYSKTVLSRCYTPLITVEQYAADQLQAMRASTLNFSTLNFIDFLLKNDQSNILNELEDVIKKKREEEDI
jgi:predicted transcriptional regulator